MGECHHICVSVSKQVLSYKIAVQDNILIKKKGLELLYTHLVLSPALSLSHCLISSHSIKIG